MPRKTVMSVKALCAAGCKSQHLSIATGKLASACLKPRSTKFAVVRLKPRMCYWRYRKAKGQLVRAAFRRPAQSSKSRSKCRSFTNWRAVLQSWKVTKLRRRIEQLESRSAFRREPAPPQLFIHFVRTDGEGHLHPDQRPDFATVGDERGYDTNPCRIYRL